MLPLPPYYFEVIVVNGVVSSVVVMMTKTLLSPKVMPSIGISVGTLPVMMNT